MTAEQKKAHALSGDGTLPGRNVCLILAVRTIGNEGSRGIVRHVLGVDVLSCIGYM